MTITDDIVNSLRNPRPLYAFAGTADLAAEKLREVPALIGRIREQAPDHIEKLRATDPKVVQGRVSAQAKETQARLNGTLAELNLKDLKELRDFRKLGESVQDLALQGVGRAAEYAVKARETYDELAERGKGAVAIWRGEAADEVVEIAAVVEPPASARPAPEPKRPAAPRRTATPRKTPRTDKTAD
ncbi:hypothetical protein [Streptomyces sp. NBC_01190]|uniref:hypothetical protein n=1 Tax=Streptomyces sp. NBC_01190 TaxID=2903767 RepID=UPI003868F382|nr:hypothetical protein OG519_19375 [Streptomyces sp. NBC_01190]